MQLRVHSYFMCALFVIAACTLTSCTSRKVAGRYRIGTPSKNLELRDDGSFVFEEFSNRYSYLRADSLWGTYRHARGANRFILNADSSQYCYATPSVIAADALIATSDKGMQIQMLGLEDCSKSQSEDNSKVNTKLANIPICDCGIRLYSEKGTLIPYTYDSVKDVLVVARKHLRKCNSIFPVRCRKVYSPFTCASLQRQQLNVVRYDSNAPHGVQKPLFNVSLRCKRNYVQLLNAKLYRW
jgi:hypothetical protein